MVIGYSISITNVKQINTKGVLNMEEIIEAVKEAAQVVVVVVVNEVIDKIVEIVEENV